MSKNISLLGLVTILFAGLVGTGCAGTAGTSAANPTLLVRQEAARVVVQGEGTVAGGPIACGSRDAQACEAKFEDLAATRLRAEPAAGWTFTGWQRKVKGERLSASVGAEPTVVVYTATFEPAEVRTADRSH